MNELEFILLQANQAFNQAMAKLQPQENKSLRPQPNSPKQISEEKLKALDFTSEETLNLLISSVPEYVYDQQLVEVTEQLKLRQICPERKSKLFTGLYQKQKKAIQQRQKLVQISNSIVPETFNGSAEFKIKWNSKEQYFSVKSDDLKKLKEHEDLNDTIMTSYLKILKLFFIPAEIEAKTFFFSTFFMGQLMGGVANRQQNTYPPHANKKQQEELRKKIKENYPKVKNWTKKIDIFSMDYLLIPMNPNNHWNFIIVLNPGSILSEKNTCKIIGLDSMFQFKQVFYHVIKLYLQLKASEVSEKQIQLQQIKSYQLLLPRQTNNHDCGLYLLTYIETLFSNPCNLEKLNRNEKDFLHLFPRQLVQTMRVDLKNLLYSLIKNSENAQRIITHLQEYKKSRNKILGMEDPDYDEIDRREFQKYCKLCPFYSEEIQEFLVIKFYLDGDINYYQKVNNP